MARTRTGGLRDRLINATDELLDGAAPGTLTTRGIAHHAAVSDGVLYNHFKDKDELLVAALLRRYVRLVETFEATLAGAHAGAGKGIGPNLESWLRIFARALRDLEAAALHLGAGLLAEPKLLNRFWVEIHRPPLGIDRLSRPLAERIAAEQEAGRLPRDIDVEAAAAIVFGASAMNALSLRINPSADREQLDRSLDASIRIVLAGLR